MIRPIDKYPGQVDTTDLGYPYGKAQACAFDGDPSGTPYAVDIVNDIWGSQVAILHEAGMVPSGSTETRTNSQLLDAIKHLIAKGTPVASSWTSSLGVPLGTVAYAIVAFKGKVFTFGSYNSTEGFRGTSADGGVSFTYDLGDDAQHYGAAADDATMIMIQDIKVFSTTTGSGWSEHNGPGGGLTHAAICNTRWITGDVSNIHSSNDQGGTWADITPAGITLISRVRSFSGSLYVCHSTGIKKSADNGSTWTDVAVHAQPWDDVYINGSDVMAVAGSGTYASQFNALKTPKSDTSGYMTEVIFTEGTYVGFGLEGVYSSTGGSFVLRYCGFRSHNNHAAVTETGGLVFAGNDGTTAYSG